jgi:hypothetical protein
MKKWKLMLTSLPLVLIVLAAKLSLTEYAGFAGILEISEIGLILTGGIFLIGFMLAGTMADYKESEKIPAELASGLESLEETLLLAANSKNSLNAKTLKSNLFVISGNIHNWMMKKISYEQLSQAFTDFNKTIYSLDQAGVAPPIVTKTLNELQAVRKSVSRINVISRTGFLSTGYALLELLILLIIILMMITKFKTLEAEIIIVFFITLIYTYMYRLIKDIDDPFEYAEGKERGAAEVPLTPLTEYITKAKSRL